MGNVACALFGHKPMLYGSQGRIFGPYYDGVGRAHRSVYARCARCDQMFSVGGVIDPLAAAKRPTQESSHERG